MKKLLVLFNAKEVRTYTFNTPILVKSYIRHSILYLPRSGRLAACMGW